MAMIPVGLAFESTKNALRDVKVLFTDASLKGTMDVAISTPAIQDLVPPKGKLLATPYSNAETNASLAVGSLNAIGAAAKCLLGPAVDADKQIDSRVI